jgi:hypothetical protein
MEAGQSSAVTIRRELCCSATRRKRVEAVDSERAMIGAFAGSFGQTFVFPIQRM